MAQEAFCAGRCLQWSGALYRVFHHPHAHLRREHLVGGEDQDADAERDRPGTDERGRNLCVFLGLDGHLHRPSGGPVCDFDGHHRQCDGVAFVGHFAVAGDLRRHQRHQRRGGRGAQHPPGHFLPGVPDGHQRRVLRDVQQPGQPQCGADEFHRRVHLPADLVHDPGPGD